MKKLLGIMLLCLLWCNVGIAGIKEPGKDEKCLEGRGHEFSSFKEAHDIIKNNLK